MQGFKETGGMRGSVVFLSVEQVKSIHRRMIEEFGGDISIRDRGLLESAAAMPQAQFGGEYLHGSVSEMAAAYLFHICQNHPFVDGNKRTAWATAEVFLLLNEGRLKASNKEIEKMVFGEAEGKLSKGQVTKFFNQHVVFES